MGWEYEHLKAHMQTCELHKREGFKQPWKLFSTNPTKTGQTIYNLVPTTSPFTLLLSLSLPPSLSLSLYIYIYIYILFFEVFTVHIVGTNCALEWPFEFEFALFWLTNLHKPMGIGKWVLYKDFLGFQKVSKILCEPLNGAWVWDSESYDIYPMYPTWAREPGTKLWTPLLNFWGLGPFSWYIIISLGPHSDPSRRGSRWDDTYCNFFFFH